MSAWGYGVTGAEAAVGHVCVWLTWTAGGGRTGPDGPDADRAAELDRLYSLVRALLGEDPALRLAAEECAGPGGAVSDRTRRRLALALDEAVEREATLAAALAAALDRLRDRGGAPPGAPPAASAPSAVSATGDGIATGGDITVRAHDRSAAAVRMGDVRMENPLPPGPPQG
ncbi:hypothetical protein [Actinacidiphila alni]|uniref:hypothetical protein n=1 Tax=Actinacidiphila alni TaxID=380248 RepID=UPI0034571BCA